MGNLKLWKDPFWGNRFNDMIDLFNETPIFIDKTFKKSNIVTNDKDYRIQVAVPGLTKDDVKISINDSVITISHESEKTDEKSFYFTSSFRKQYSLPDDCDENKISSKLENGILEIVIPRDKKKTNERFIEIN